MLTPVPTSVIYLLSFGCAGSSLLRGLSLVAASGGYSVIAVLRLSLQWLLLFQSMGSTAGELQ